MNFKATLVVLLSLATLISCETEADEFDDGVTVEDENVKKFESLLFASWIVMS